MAASSPDSSSSNQDASHWLKRCGPLLDMVRVAERVLRWGNVLTLLVIAGSLLVMGAVVVAQTEDAAGALALTGGMAVVSLLAALLSSHGLRLVLRESGEKTDVCLFLRAFRTDRGSDKLRAWLKAALGKSFQLAGIRPPKERASRLLSLLGPVLTGLRYVGTSQFQLEAPDRNWMARLLGSFQTCRFVFIDARDVTAHVRDEIRLAWQVFGPSRILFVVDDKRTPEVWRRELLRMLGLEPAGAPGKLHTVVWPDDGKADAGGLTAAVRAFVAQLPPGSPAIPRKAFEFVRDRVNGPDWASRALEREGPVVFASLASAFTLGIVPLGMLEHLRTFATIGIGALLQVFLWRAWWRACRQNRLSRQLYPAGAAPRWRLWKAFACLSILPLTMVLALGAALAIPAFNEVEKKARETQAASAARQVTMVLKMHAAENGGSYPDSGMERVGNSNEAFRRLFQEQLVYEESIFATKAGAYRADRNIGNPPDFDQALTAGENQWALTMGLSDTSNADIPLIYTAPVRPSWPPAWAEPTSPPKPGEAMPGRRIIVARNSGAVSVEKLVPEPGTGLLVPGDPGSWTRSIPQASVLNALPPP